MPTRQPLVGRGVLLDRSLLAQTALGWEYPAHHLWIMPDCLQEEECFIFPCHDVKRMHREDSGFQSCEWKRKLP